MPLRHAFVPIRPRQCLHSLYAAPLLFVSPAGAEGVATGGNSSRRRWFHGTARLRDEQIDNSQNHYETLKLHPGATPAEIKKSFYTLSKTHHPDVNPANPSASRRFMRISEAYSVLSIPAKRAAYDRDTLRLSPHSAHSRHHGHSSSSSPSYSSTNPAGGRPPSGLSRRRGTFQGPPPSFFRSGGWGSHGAKRRAAHDDSTGTTSSAGGMGPGQSPHRHESTTPDEAAAETLRHFDRASHERTGRQSDRRRAARQESSDGRRTNVEVERGVAGMFFVIGGVIALSVLVPFGVGGMVRDSVSVSSGGNSGNGVGGNGGNGGNGERKGGRARKPPPPPPPSPSPSPTDGVAAL